MADIERPTQNWTRYPNCILDNLDQFTGNELKIISLMIRKNIGWEDSGSPPSKKFSVSYISKKTGLSKPTVLSSLENLKGKESILEIESAERGTRRFEINWAPPLVKKFDQSKTVTGKNSLPEPVKKFDQNRSKNLTQLNKLKEDIYKKKLTPAEPEPPTPPKPAIEPPPPPEAAAVFCKDSFKNQPEDLQQLFSLVGDAVDSRVERVIQENLRKYGAARITRNILYTKQKAPGDFAAYLFKAIAADWGEATPPPAPKPKAPPAPIMPPPPDPEAEAAEAQAKEKFIKLSDADHRKFEARFKEAKAGNRFELRRFREKGRECLSYVLFVTGVLMGEEVGATA